MMRTQRGQTYVRDGSSDAHHQQAKISNSPYSRVSTDIKPKNRIVDGNRALTLKLLWFALFVVGVLAAPVTAQTLLDATLETATPYVELTYALLDRPTTTALIFRIYRTDVGRDGRALGFVVSFYGPDVAIPSSIVWRANGQSGTIGLSYYDSEVTNGVHRHMYYSEYFDPSMRRSWVMSGTVGLDFSPETAIGFFESGREMPQAVADLIMLDIVPPGPERDALFARYRLID